MRSLEEFKKLSSVKREEDKVYGPDKDILYEQYMASRPKVAGGTVNPIISTSPKVVENKNLEGRKSQTYAQALAANRAKASALGANVPEVAKPSGKIREMIFGTAKRGGTINPAISAADFSTRYDSMTDRENAIYSYYKKAGREKEAAEYLKSIEMDMNQREAAKRTADAKKLAEDSTVGGLYARYMAGLTSPMGAIYGAVQEGRGKAIDPNSPLFMGEQIRQGQTEGFVGESTGLKKAAKEAALGAFDWGTQVATLGAMGLSGAGLGAGNSALYGASAFGGNVKDATERGATASEAVTYGAIGAAAEIITEKMGFDRLFELGKMAKNKGAIVRTLKSILPNMASEGMEEGTTEAVNLIADALIMGDKSQMAEVYNGAKAQGMTEGQAAKEALLTAAKQIGYSGGVGALSGGLIAGGVAGLSRGLGRNALGETAVTEKTSASGTVDGVSKPVENIGEKPKNVGEMQKNGEKSSNNAGKMKETTAEMGVAEATKTQGAESVSEELEGFGEKYYGEKGKEVFLRLAQEKGNLDHTAAFNTYYRAGIAGITEKEIKPTAYTAGAEKMLLNEAYMAGAEDRRAEIANAIRGRNKLSGKRGLILGEDVKATEGQMAITKLYADIGGAQIRLVDEISFEQDGKKRYANGKIEDGVITIALKNDSFLGTMHHEMVHYIRKANPAGYDAMRELVFNLANKSGIDMEKTMERYRRDYGSVYGEDTQMADIMEEVVADAFQKIVESKSDLKVFLNELHKRDRTLFERIKDFLEKMEETIKALFRDNTYTEFAEELSKDLENIKALRRKFAEVLADTGKMEELEENKKGLGKIKFSKKEKRESYRRTNGKAIHENVGYAMFSDDEESIRSYGKNLYVIEHDNLTDVSEIKDKFAEAWDEWKEGGFLPGNLEDLYDYDGAELAEELDPDDIVDSAEMWDRPDVISWAYDAGVFDDVEVGIKTKNGAIVFDEDKILKKDGEVKFSFAGEKAWEANEDMLEEAKRMEKEGREKEEIFRKTGWFRGMDKKWRFEIDDSQFQFFPDGDAFLAEDGEYQRLKKMLQKGDFDNPDFERLYEKYSDEFEGEKNFLGNYMQHEALFRNYPFMQAARIRFEDLEAGARGRYDPENNEIILDKGMQSEYMTEPAKRTLLHEIQHAIQSFEGFTGGSSIAYWEKQQKNGFSKKKNGVKMNAYELYQNTAGEIEARDTANRKDMTAAQRKEEFPDLGDENVVFKDTKFSLSKPVEETKDLIALHNLSAESFTEALKLGGFHMPSIAIVKDKMGHEKYGEISVVFGKDTIDPEADSRNAVFGGDGWTPTRPRVEYPVDYDRKTEIEDGLEGLAKKVANGIFARASILSSLGVEDGTGMNRRDIAEKLAGQDMVRAAYLAEQGKDIDPVYQEKKYDRYGNEFLQKIIDRFGEQELAKKAVKLNLGEELNDDEIFAVREIWKQNWIDSLPEGMKRKRTPEQIAEKAEENAEKKVQSYEAGKFILHAWEMYEDGGGVSEEIDRLATSDRLQEETNYKDVADWAEGKLDGLLGEPGIYNGKEYYTASGNRRSFKQLHYPYTLENIVKAMNEAQKERGEGLWGLTASGLQSVAVAEYGSIEEIRGDRGRLRMEGEEDYKKALEALDEKIGAVMQKIRNTTEAHSSNPYIESDIIGGIIIEAAAKGKQTAQSVKRHFANEGYRIRDSIAKEIVGMFEDAARIPTGYFEAKPKRAVGLDEILYVVLPDNADTELKKELEARGIPVEEYEYGNSESRLQAVNSRENVKFSIRKEEMEADIAENTHWKAAYEGLLREFEVTKEPLKDRESAKKVVRRFLKKIQSKYNEEEFLDRFVSLCNYGADMQSDSDYKDLLTACTMLAEDALRESQHINRELYDTYADLRKQLRENTLHVGKETLKELEAMGINYNELRTKNFGRVRISQRSGEEIDTKYAELAETYPELFKADQSTSRGELLMDMIAVRESLEPTIENPYFDNMEEYAAASAYELLGMMNDVALEKQTFADKYEEKLRKLREENRKALQNAREQARNEKKLLQEKYATNAEARIEAVKQKYEKRMDRKEYWRLRKLAVKDAKALAEWLKAPTDKNHVPKKFKEGVETILALIETEKPDLQIPLRSFVAMRGGLMELYGDTEGIYLYVERDEQVINILDRFIQKYPEGANLDTMDGTDMKYFRNLIASVKKACTDANRLHTSQREKSVVELSDGFIRESQKKKDAKEMGIVRRINDFFGLEMLDANSFFKRIGGDVYGELWKGLRKGMDKKIGRWREAMDFINGLVDPKEVRKWTDAPAREFNIGGTKVYLTIPQIMSLACLMRRSQGRQHIIGMDLPTESGILRIRGGGFKAENLAKDKKAKQEKEKVVEPTEADIREIIGTLTEEQARVAYEIQKYLSGDVAAWGNETTMLLFGYEKFTTENYFPIVSDKNFVNQLVTKTDDIAPSLKSMGMTKNINQYANNPVIIQDIFKVFANHIDQMSNYNAFVASESDFNKFLNYKAKAEDGRIYSVKDEMDRTMGAGGVKYIKTLMNRLVTSTGLSDDSDFAKMFVRNMKVASVGANLRVIVQQPTAYLRAANQMSLKYLLNPAVFGKTDKKIIYKYAPIALWKSWGNYEMDTGKTMYEQIIAPTKFAWTKDKMMAGAGLADELTWSRLWNACVLETRDRHKGLSEEETYRIAGERFGEIVDESQVVDSILHRSQIMRKKGLYTQMATSFMSEPIKNFNMAGNALVEMVRENTPENRKKFMRCYLTIIASGVATACAAGMVDAMRDDDDEEEFFRKWKKAVLGDYTKAETPKDIAMAALSNNIADNLNPMGMIPYLRDAWSMIQGYDIKRTDFDWLNDILKSMKRWKDFIAGESEYTLYSMLLNTAGAVSKMAGIPIGSAERDLKAFSNLIVLHIIGDDEMKYDYRKLSKDIGSEKNASYYVERMLQAKFSGNEALATRTYNDMVKAGISNETIDSKIETQEKKALKEEPAAAEAAEAYAAGDYEGYMDALDSLAEKGYGRKNAVSMIESIYKKRNGAQEDEETFDTITRDYWEQEGEDPAGYEMMFNAFMNGSEKDYKQMWDRLEASGKEEKNIKQSMKTRLKKAYQEAKAEGNYQEAQKAKNEFLRLGGKPETLEN